MTILTFQFLIFIHYFFQPGKINMKWFINVTKIGKIGTKSSSRI